MTLPKNPQVLLVGGVLLAVGVWVFFRGFGGVAKDATKAAVNVATGAAAGVVVGAGEVVGIPDTNQTQCEIDCAAGNGFQASMSCSMSRYFRYLRDGK